MLSLYDVVNDFAVALKAVDSTAPQGRSRTRVYQPGVGPLTEADAVGKALQYLKESAYSSRYENASPKLYPGSRQQCDLVIPDAWAIEFKLIRPFNDNGTEAEHWSENALHPYAGNVSAVGDCIKLTRSAFIERKAVILLGYSHMPPKIDLGPVVRSFEVIVEQVTSIRLSSKCSAEFAPLMHPIHQQGWLFGWEIQS